MSVNYQTHQFDSFDQIPPEVLGGPPFEQRLLRGGKFQATLERLTLPNSCLDRGVYTLPCFARGAGSSELIGIGMTDSSEEPAWLNGVSLHPNDVQIFAEGAPVDYRSVPAGAWYAFQTSRELIQTLSLTVAGFEIPIPNQGFRNFRLTRAAAQQLKYAFKSSLEAAHEFANDEPGLALQWIESKLVGNVLRAISESPLQADGRTERTACRNWNAVRRLEEFIDDHLEENIGTRELANSVGVSERSLQYLLNHAYGASPSELLLVTRLNRIRRTLMSGDRYSISIREIARKHGIFHGGRFAARYKSLFGETPYETISNRC